MIKCIVTPYISKKTMDTIASIEIEGKKELVILPSEAPLQEPVEVGIEREGKIFKARWFRAVPSPFIKAKMPRGEKKHTLNTLPKVEVYTNTQNQETYLRLGEKEFIVTPQDVKSLKQFAKDRKLHPTSSRHLNFHIYRVLRAHLNSYIHHHGNQVPNKQEVVSRDD